LLRRMRDWRRREASCNQSYTSSMRDWNHSLMRSAWDGRTQHQVSMTGLRTCEDVRRRHWRIRWRLRESV
jgi:hypothetical protein